MSSAAYTIIKELGRSKEIQEKILQECREFGLLDDLERNISYELLEKMTYVHNVVKEALRVSPPIGGAFRKVKETFELNVCLIFSLHM